MKKHEPEIHYEELAESVIARIYSLRRYLSQLQKQEYSTEASHHLATLFFRLTHFYEAVVHDSNARFKIAGSKIDAVELENLRDEILNISAELHEISRSIRFIETSRSESSPSELPAILDSLIKTVSPTLALIIRPQSAYEYEYRNVMRASLQYPSELFRSSLELPGLALQQRRYTIPSLLEGLPDAIAVVNYPQIERDNVLRHSFHVGHELGHFLDEALNIKDDFLFPTKEDGEISSLIDLPQVEQLAREIKSKVANDLKSVRLKVMADVSAKFERWLSELICDIIAVNLSGPAAVVALLSSGFGERSFDFEFVELTPRQQLPQPSNIPFYPWLRLRLQVMLFALEANGFRESIEGLPHLSKKLAIARTLAETKREQIQDLVAGDPWPADADLLRRRIILETTRIVANATKRAIPSVFPSSSGGPNLLAAVSEKLRSIPQSEYLWVYKSSDCVHEVSSLVRGMTAGVLPCQTIIFIEESSVSTRPARFASILIAGWEHWLSLPIDTPAKRSEALSELNALLATSLEASQIQKRFQYERSRLSSTS